MGSKVEAKWTSAHINIYGKEKPDPLAKKNDAMTRADYAQKV
jgi:hypothetical protein